MTAASTNPAPVTAPTAAASEFDAPADGIAVGGVIMFPGVAVVADKVAYVAQSTAAYVQIGTVNGAVNVPSTHARVTHLLVEALSHTAAAMS